MQTKVGDLSMNVWRKEKHHRLYVEQGMAGKTVRLGYIDLKRGEARDDDPEQPMEQALEARGLTLNSVLREYADDPHEYNVDEVFPEQANYALIGNDGKPQAAAYRLYFDGGAEPTNPGDGYGSYAIFACDAEGHFPVESESPVLTQFKPNMTNNEAEYSALIVGLTALIAQLEAAEVDPAVCAVDIWGDSNLVVQQVAGEWQVKEPRLRPYCQQAQALCDRFADVRLSHHYRVHSMIVLGH